MNTKKKILIAVPYHKKKRYCLGQLYTSLENVSSNARSSGFEVEVVIRHDLNPFGQKDNVKIQRNFFRNLALEKDFDFLFFHGADTIPPVNIISMLYQWKYPIVSGVYWQRGEKKAVNAICWNKMQTKQKNDLVRKRFNDELEEAKFPMTVAMDGIGLDCVLIAREVLEKISWMDWDVNDDDYPFCDKAKDRGYRIYVDRSAQCKHWDTSTTYSFNGEYVNLMYNKKADHAGF